MKQVVIAVAVLGGTLLLLSLCAAGGALMGWGWFAADPAPGQKIVRLTPLPPPTLAPHLPDAAPVVLPTATPVNSSSPVLPVSPRPSPPPPTAKTLPPVAPAETIARLVIPKLGVEASVVSAPMNEESWQVEHLGQAVGHLAGTAPPGASGNLVLAGHVTLESGQPGPFIHLDQLTAGDAVYVDQSDRRIEYVIDGSQIVDREAIEVTYPTETAVLTLITCSRWDETQARYLDRLVVQGHPVSP